MISIRNMVEIESNGFRIRQGIDGFTLNPTQPKDYNGGNGKLLFIEKP